MEFVLKNARESIRMSTGPKDQLESADAGRTLMSAVDAPITLLPEVPPVPSSGGLLKKLASKGVWALADQAVVSIGNFVTVILVLRNLTNASEVALFRICWRCCCFSTGFSRHW